MTTETQKPAESVVATINKTMQEGRMTQLAPGRLLLAEHAHQTFVAVPEADTPPDALIDSKYWAHYAVNSTYELKPGDMILVKPEDGTYFAELMVRAVSRGNVQVAEIRRVQLDKAQVPAEEDDHEIRHSGSIKKWRVIRKADKRELISGLATRDAAIDWLREHRKAFAA